jgi:hypothetical protein
MGGPDKAQKLIDVVGNSTKPHGRTKLESFKHFWTPWKFQSLFNMVGGGGGEHVEQ